MFVYNGADYTIPVIGLLGAVFFMALQLLLCFKVRPLAGKLIPAYLILLGLLYGLGTWLGLFGTYSLGAIAGHEIVALILLIIVGIASLGESLAWVVYLVVRWKRS